MPVEACFEGVGVALVTIFDEERRVAVEETVEHALRTVDAGVRAVVVAGSTGEAPALTLEERVALVRACRQALPPPIPVLCGSGEPTAYQAVETTAAAVEAGADGVLVLSPLRAGDPRPYYSAVRKAAGATPVLGYHFPAMSPPGIPVDLLSDLDVDGVKDSSGDPDRLLAQAVAYDGALYTGSSALLVQAGALGCTGAILALANLEPEDCIRALGGDGDAQRRLAAPHAAARADFPHGLKRELARRHGTPTHARMG